MSDCECPECFYCRMPLAPRHEHDHFPVPKRHGGKFTVAVCLGCHELKDRTPLTKWPADAAFAALRSIFDKCNPVERITLAKFLMVHCDAEARLRELEDPVEPPTAPASQAS